MSKKSFEKIEDMTITAVTIKKTETPLDLTIDSLYSKDKKVNHFFEAIQKKTTTQAEQLIQFAEKQPNKTEVLINMFTVAKGNTNAFSIAAKAETFNFNMTRLLIATCIKHGFTDILEDFSKHTGYFGETINYDVSLDQFQTAKDSWLKERVNKDIFSSEMGMLQKHGLFHENMHNNDKMEALGFDPKNQPVTAEIAAAYKKHAPFYSLTRMFFSVSKPLTLTSLIERANKNPLGASAKALADLRHTMINAPVELTTKTATPNKPISRI